MLNGSSWDIYIVDDFTKNNIPMGISAAVQDDQEYMTVIGARKFQNPRHYHVEKCALAMPGTVGTITSTYRNSVLQIGMVGVCC